MFQGTVLRVVWANREIPLLLGAGFNSAVQRVRSLQGVLLNRMFQDVPVLGDLMYTLLSRLLCAVLGFVAVGLALTYIIGLAGL